MITSFDSTGEYFRFMFAKCFYTNSDQSEEFTYKKNFLEKIGGVGIYGSSTVADFMLRHIRSPLMIVALTVAAIALVTIAFYPAVFVSTVSTIFPFVLVIQPWMIKFVVYAFVQWNIIGVCLRTIGRLSNSTLMESWINKDVRPVSIGVEIVREQINA